MATLGEIRQQYPEYGDMSDVQLADAMHRKFYSDMPVAEFDAKIGLQRPPERKADAFASGLIQGGGMGWGDEMAGLKAASGVPEQVNLIPGGSLVQPLVGGAKLLYEKAIGGSDASKQYTEARDAFRSNDASLAQQHPYIHTGGQLTGAVATSLIPGGAAVRAPSALGTIARGAGVGAGLGATQGAGEAASVEDIPRDAATGAAIGAGVGAIIPTAAAGVRRLISPSTISPERQAMVDILRQEGIQPTAGQTTGNRALRWAESALGDTPFAGRAASDAMDRQGQQFTSAVLQRVGEDAPLATPEVMRNAAGRIGGQFDSLSARNTLTGDHQLVGDLGNVIGNYMDRVIPSQRAAGRQNVEGIIQDVVDVMRRNGGTMSGELYQATRSRLGDMAHDLSQKDPTLADAVGGIRNALDGAMNRSISPADQAAWAQARSQYGHMKTVEKAAAGGGERAAEGYLSPLQLRGALVNRNQTQYARGQGDLAELTRAANAIMAPLPQSGTAPRQAVQTLLSGLGAGAGGAAGGIPGAVAGLATPALLGRALMSRPVQAYLTNQVAAGQASPEILRLADALLASPARQTAISASDEHRRHRSATR